MAGQIYHYVSVWMNGTVLKCVENRQEVQLPPEVEITIKDAIKRTPHGTVIHEKTEIYCWQKDH